jgi:hypothetical protein
MSLGGLICGRLQTSSTTAGAGIHFVFSVSLQYKGAGEEFLKLLIEFKFRLDVADFNSILHVSCEVAPVPC